MEGFLTELGKTLVEKLINGVIEKSRYLFCFKCIAKEFELEKDNLEAERKTMRQRFGVAIERDKDIQFNAQFWEEQAEKFIQEDTKTNQRCFFGFCPNCIWRYKRGEELANKIEEIKKLVEKGEKFENIELARRLPDVERYSSQYYISFKSLLKQGRKLANECKGLPVAIATIASSLKGQKGREEWDVALKSLKNPMSMGGVEEDLVYIYKCLKFSYDNLTDKKAKELFLLCSVFQEDEEISIEILTRLGIGVDIFREGCDKYNDARNLVVVAKNKLLDSSLLLKTNKRDVKMHDLIREVAHWIANKEILVVDSSNKNQMSSLVGKGNIKYLLFEGNSMDLCSSRFDGSKLKILIFIMDKGCFVDSFLKNIAGLRVLNLIASKDEYSKSLETLDLNFCTIDELPQEISELKKLRLLNLEKCNIRSSNPFKVIQRCPSLEELYFLNSFNDFCEEITLPTLERYHLTDFYRYDSSLSKCVSLHHHYLSEATYVYVIQTAEYLSLQSIKKGWRNLMPEIVPIDQGMNDLIELCLNLKYDSQLECLIDTEHIGSPVPNVFTNLVVLELEKLENLKQLCNGPISSDFLNNLEKLTIMYCGNLRSLVKYSLNLCNLKTVILSSCSKLVSVFDLSTSQSLLLLEYLSITDCMQLKDIFTNERKSNLPVDGDNDNNKTCNSLFPKLESIYIARCYNLKHIFGQHQDVELASLKELELNCLPNFIGIFPESYHSFEGSSHSISKPQIQVEVEPIKSNRFPWNRVCCGYKLRGSSSSSTSNKIAIPSVYEDQPQHDSIPLEWYCLLRLSHVMCNIKVIDLSHIPRIKSVFTLSVAQKMSSLESLTIFGCYELEHIVVDIGDGSGTTGVNIIFPNLKELKVSDCEKLEYIFGHINASDHQYHHHQNHLLLPALISLYLSFLPSLIGMGTKNYHITLPHLVELNLTRCPQVVYSMSKSQDTTTTKDLSGNDLEAHLALENLTAMQSKFQYIFYLDEINGQQRNFGLKKIELYDLHQMTYVFLLDLRIEECDELKYIVEEDDDDVENKEISNDHMSLIRTCFPKLRTVYVIKCNKLEYVLPTSMCTELPELWLLMIAEAAKLEKIFGGSEEKVGRFPNLNSVVFVELPSFIQGIQFQTIEHRLVHNCQKLSLTSSSTLAFYEDKLDYDLFVCLKRLLREHSETEEDTNATPIQSSTSETRNEPPRQLVADLKQKDTKLSSEDLDLGDSKQTIHQTNNQVEPSKEESEAASRQELTSSQCLKEKEDQSIEEGSTSEKRNAPMQLVDDLKQKDIKLSFKDIDLDDSKETTQTNNQVEPSKKESEAVSRPELTSSQIKMKQASEAEHEFVKNVPDLEIPPVGEFDTSSWIATKKGFSERFARLNNKQYLGLSVAVVGISVVAGFLYLRKK
ncbi:putative disease resistance protein [Trifolium repens]|nr:putative disease resistance protein [Trifolium repens]